MPSSDIGLSLAAIRLKPGVGLAALQPLIKQGFGKRLQLEGTRTSDRN
jgi:hypothetical protein